MKFLLACSACARQHNVEGLAAKSRFHCLCGDVLEVPRFTPHDAAVVRCTSCGAPRTEGAESCKFCNADYTLHERDLHTICSSCMTRVSDKGRFCHQCGVAVLPSEDAGELTDRRCPVCGVKQMLRSRRLGSSDVSLLECSRCAGIWLDREAFELLAEKARVQALPDIGAVGETAEEGVASIEQKGPLYRRCPRCREMMNRRNFGRRSSVIVDTCKEHGIWFDAHELDRILRWVRRGGEERAAIREADDARHAERQARFKQDLEARTDRTNSIGFPTDEGQSGFDGLVHIVRILFGLL